MEFEARTSVLVAVSMMALQLSRESNVLLSLSTVIDIRLLQLRKACGLIFSTETGIKRLLNS